MSVPAASPPCLPSAAALQAPWWQPYRALLAAWPPPGLALDAPVAAGLNALAAAQGGAPVRFVGQQALPGGQAYEAFIRAHGQVPTRDNAHDLFNGLVWLRLPRAKRQLNALQAGEIQRAGVGARRGPVRDACTLFDENAALLHAPDALWQALAQRRWAELFGPLRPLWGQASLLVFGHAALEKLLSPYKSITAHVWRVALPFDGAGDGRLAGGRPDGRQAGAQALRAAAAAGRAGLVASQPGAGVLRRRRGVPAAAGGSHPGVSRCGNGFRSNRAPAPDQPAPAAIKTIVHQLPGRALSQADQSTG